MTAGFPVHLRRFKKRPRRAVAIHCTQAHGGAWRGVARCLADCLTILAPDMPAHGKSGDWDFTGNLHNITYAALLPLVQNEPVDLIGHSFGATIALRMAVEVPDQIRSLTLIEPVYFAVCHDASTCGAQWLGRAAYLHYLKSAWVLGLKTYDGLPKTTKRKCDRFVILTSPNTALPIGKEPRPPKELQNGTY